MNRIITDFMKIQGDLLTMGHRVIDKMENNEAFSDAPEALAQLKKILPDFQEALANAMSRDKEMVAIKNNLKAVVLDLMQELIEYVTETSKGDRALILSSGFIVDNENGKGNKQPPSIEKLEVILGATGEAITRIKNVTNAIAFVHQYSTELPGKHTKWVGEGTSLSHYTFQGLTSEERHWFRVVAIGYYGLRGYSPVISRVIQ